MTHYNHEALQEMIPLYVNGRLSDRERASFEKALHQHPELQQEVAEFSEIKDAYKEIEQDLSVPSERMFSRIEAAISGEEQHPVVSFEPSLWERFTAAAKVLIERPIDLVSILDGAT